MVVTQEREEEECPVFKRFIRIRELRREIKTQVQAGGGHMTPAAA